MKRPVIQKCMMGERNYWWNDHREDIKHTKTNQMMAFITIEDLLGTVEVVVFPRDYEKNRDYLEVDSKVFVRGRVSEEDDKPSKLI